MEEVVKEIFEKSAEESNKYKSIEVKKHLDVDLDVGNLLMVDHNAFDQHLWKKNKEDCFIELARENTQLLINHIWELPTERVDEVIMVKLPPPKTVLPRMRPVPRPKPLTKWQKFAKEKGIQSKKKSKLSWDEQLQKWIPMYGFKKVKADKEKNWVLEVPQNVDQFQDQFAKKAEARSENVAKNELQRLRNLAKAKKVKIPRTGVTISEASSAKDLQVAVTVAKSATASIGQFQNKLPKEKEARGVSAITPGASRKRKLPPVSGDTEKNENLNIVDAILTKRPKLNIEKAVSSQIHRTSRNKKTTDQKKNKMGKKPKSGKGQRKGEKKGAGRKRR